MVEDLVAWSVEGEAARKGDSAHRHIQTHLGHRVRVEPSRAADRLALVAGRRKDCTRDLSKLEMETRG